MWHASMALAGGRSEAIVSEAAVLLSSSCQPIFLCCILVSELFYISGILTSPLLQEVEAVFLPQTQ